MPTTKGGGVSEAWHAPRHVSTLGASTKGTVPSSPTKCPSSTQVRASVRFYGCSLAEVCVLPSVTRAGATVVKANSAAETRMTMR